jgi:hypothetical protein
VAERVRTAGILGRSQPMQRLFDYLVACSERGETPREYDIAVEVFNRGESFDVSQDASVRVYVHRLRQKLDEYYDGEGREEALRLVIPKGEYKLDLAERAEESGADPSQAAEAAPRRRRLVPWLAAGFLRLLAINAGIWAALWPHDTTADPMVETRQASFWTPIMHDDRSIIVVVGDYYIFGDLESGTNMDVQRLIREFSVNSPRDLYEYLMSHPVDADKYVDIGLRYLPTSIAFALSRVLPVLGAANSRVRVVLSSDLTPAMIKTSHIIYIGLLSGLESMRDPVFAKSRFSVGTSYDEIIDTKTNQHYVSQINRFDSLDSSSLDYGFLSAFNGPTGNRILVIAGTRDVALRQMAEEITERGTLDALAKSVSDAPSFEALYSVEAMEQFNMSAKLIAADALDSAAIWNNTKNLRFPTR